MRVQTGVDLAVGGDAVARASDGRVIFIPNAAPDELVELEIVEERKSFLRARLLTVVEPGPSRTTPRCAHFDVCGGCSLQHVTASEQTRTKAVALREAIQRIGRVDLQNTQIDSPWTGPPYGYRTRVKLAVASRGVVGYRAASSHKIVNVEACPILAPPLERALAVVRAAARSVKIRARNRAVQEISAVSNTQKAILALPKGLSFLADHIVSDEVVSVADRKRSTLDAEDDKGAMLLSPRVFAQANHEGNRALVEYVEGLLPNVAAAIELYSGSGNLTRVIAGRAGHVLCVESDASACVLARRVAPDNIEVVQGDVEEALEKTLDRNTNAGLLVMNPPRVGVSDKALTLIGRLAPKTIVYVSCNPATFARDVGRLAERGFALDRLRMFDLYPQTAHLEAVGRLRS